MYTRQQVWQDPIITSVSKSEWENNIVMGMPGIDIRFKLTGYGWKPNADDVNLTILNEGRYDCYYREQFATTWIKFATVISERADNSLDKVYEDTYLSLGVVASGVYEVKIVAADAEKFASWGGTLEGISGGNQFWYELKIRADRPYIINRTEDISVQDYAILGSGTIEISIEDYAVLLDIIGVIRVYGFDVFSSFSIQETFTIEVNIALSGYDDISVVENFETWKGWVNVATPYETVSITENINIFLSIIYMFGFEEINIEEILNLNLSVYFLSIYEEISINEYVQIWTEPPWHTWNNIEEITVTENVQLDIFNVLYFDDCSSLISWANQSTGNGSAQVSVGKFLLHGESGSDKGIVKKTTEIDFGDYFWFEFSYQQITQENENNYFEATVGSNTRSQTIRVQANSGVGGYVAGIEVPDVNFYNEVKISIRLLEEKETGATDHLTLSDIYVNGTYYGRTNIQSLSSKGITNGQILLETSFWTSAIFECKIDNISVMNLQDEFNLNFWRREDLTRLSYDFFIEEYAEVLVIIDYKYINKYENISVTEHILITDIMVEIPLIFETINVADVLSIDFNEKYVSVFDSLEITEMAIVGLPELVLAVTENISINEALYDESTVAEYFDLVSGLLFVDSYDIGSVAEYISAYTQRKIFDNDGTNFTGWDISAVNATRAIDAGQWRFWNLGGTGTILTTWKSNSNSGILMSSNLDFTMRMKFSTTIDTGRVELQIYGGANYNFFFKIIFRRLNLSLEVGDSGVQNNMYTNDVYHVWRFRIMGSSKKTFIRVYRDGVWMFDAQETLAATGNGAQMVIEDDDGGGMLTWFDYFRIYTEYEDLGTTDGIGSLAWEPTITITEDISMVIV